MEALAPSSRGRRPSRPSPCSARCGPLRPPTGRRSGPPQCRPHPQQLERELDVWTRAHEKDTAALAEHMRAMLQERDGAPMPEYKIVQNTS